MLDSYSEVTSCFLLLHPGKYEGHLRVACAVSPLSAFRCVWLGHYCAKMLKPEESWSTGLLGCCSDIGVCTYHCQCTIECCIASAVDNAARLQAVLVSGACLVCMARTPARLGAPHALGRAVAMPCVLASRVVRRLCYLNCTGAHAAHALNLLASSAAEPIHKLMHHHRRLPC